MTAQHEEVTITIQIRATVSDMDKLRLAAAYDFQQDGVGPVHTVMVDGDAHELAKMYFGREILSVVSGPGCFENPVVSAE